MSNPYDMAPMIFDLNRRNVAAEAVIKAYAIEHAAVDTVSGFILGLVPAGNLVALAGQLIYSAASNYPRMIKKLAVIYGASQDDFTNMVIAEGVVIEAGVESLVVAVGSDVLGQVTIDIVNDFGADFFKEIFWELAGEAGVATGISLIPLVGSVAGAALDATLGATLTWRIGGLVSAYFQNGGEYLGSRKGTYEAVKGKVSLSPDVSRPGTLDKVGNIDAIRRKKESYVRQYVRDHVDLLDKNTLRKVLVEKQRIPASIADAILAEF